MTWSCVANTDIGGRSVRVLFPFVWDGECILAALVACPVFIVWDSECILAALVACLVFIVWDGECILAALVSRPVCVGQSLPGLCGLAQYMCVQAWFPVLQWKL